MKNVIYIAFALLLIVPFQSCDTLGLDNVEPINSVPADGAINNIKSANAALNGVYDELQMTTTSHLDAFMALAQIYSDEAVFTGTFPTRFEFNNLNVTTSNGTNATVFTEFYDVINSANNVAEQLPLVDDPGLTPAVVNDFIGQAKMARALCYFYLVNYYGDVPLVLQSTVEVGDVLNVPNAPTNEIYIQIIEDLQFSEINITETETKKFTSQAASALLARVYLYQGNYSGALTQAEKALGSSFDLNDFTYLQDEIMFLGFTTADGNVLNFWYGPSELGGRHDIEPSPKFLGSYEEGDLRKDLSVDDSFEEATVPFVVKYDDFSSGISGTGSDPIMLFRHAEQVLIAAEAAAETGDFEKSNLYFNQIRKRAGLIEKTLDSSNYLDLIFQERWIELSFEGAHRWLDLKRRGKAVQEIEGYSPCNDVWPIPQRDIDRNPNLNQNNCCNC